MRRSNQKFAQKLIFGRDLRRRHIQKFIWFQHLDLTLIGVFPRSDGRARFNLRLFQSSNSELGSWW